MQGMQVQSQSLVGELKSYKPHGHKTKTWNRSNIITSSLRTLEIIHILKKKKKKKKNKGTDTKKSATTNHDPFLEKGFAESSREFGGFKAWATCLLAGALQ